MSIGSCAGTGQPHGTEADPEGLLMVNLLMARRDYESEYYGNGYHHSYHAVPSYNNNQNDRYGEFYQDIDEEDIDGESEEYEYEYESGYDRETARSRRFRSDFPDDPELYEEESEPGRRKRLFSVWNMILLAAIFLVCAAIVFEVTGAGSLFGTDAGEETEEDDSSVVSVAEETESEASAVAEDSTEESVQEESVDLSDIDTVLADLGLSVQFDGTVFDETWYLEELAAAGITDVDSSSETEEIYRHYQLYGQGDGLTAYDESVLDETTILKLTAYEELLRSELMEENDAAWLTVTADICDTEEVTVWNSEYEVSEEASAALEQALALFEDDGYEVGFVILDLTTGEAVSYCAGIEVYSASVIKAPYIFSLLEAGYSPTDDMYLAGNQSDNDAYLSLRETYGSAVFANWIDGTGIPSSQGSHYYIYTTPLDLCRMFYKGTDLLLGDETYSDWARSTFTDSLNSAAALTIGTSKTVYSKAGWISESDGYHSYTNAAIVDGDSPYIVTLMSDSLGYVGLEYAQVLMPVLDQIHDEMCGEESDFSGMDFAVEEFPDDTEERPWNDGAPGMGQEGTPDYVAPEGQASAEEPLAEGASEPVAGTEPSAGSEPAEGGGAPDGAGGAGGAP